MPPPDGLERRDDQVRDRTLQDCVTLSHELRLHGLVASARQQLVDPHEVGDARGRTLWPHLSPGVGDRVHDGVPDRIGWIDQADRKSTRLNSSHITISYAVFCL